MFFYGLLAVLAIVSFLILEKYLPYLLASFVLAFLAYPLYKRVRKYVSNDSVASFIVLIVLLVFAIIPTFFIARAVFMQANNALTNFQESGLDTLNTAPIENRVKTITGQEIDIKSSIEEGLSRVNQAFSSSLISLVVAAADFLMGVFIMIFTIFYLFKDGHNLIEEIKGIVPLKKKETEHLFQEAKRVAWGVLAGSIFTSVIQGVVGAIGFILFGVPNAFFWGFVMVILAIVPIIGPFVIYVPSGIYYILLGNYLLGFGILIYGLAIVAWIDNLVRPHLISRRARVHPVIILLGVIGGLSLLGAAGLFVGPVLLALFIALLRFWREER